MEEREMIEQAVKDQGLSIESWREPNEETGESLTAVLSGRWQVLNDDYEERGFYSGCEGTLSVCVVGAVEYRNQRVHWGFQEEGMDGDNELPGDVFDVLEPVD